MVTEHSIAAAHALRDTAVSDLSALDDAALVSVQSALGALGRLIARHSAATAGEIARRSSPELGHGGLAQTAGHRTPQAMIQAVTGISAAEASRLVEVGSWEVTSPLAQGVSSGAVSVEGADAIRRGLGSADASTSARTLDAVASDLVERAGGSTPEQLFRAARDARTRLDLASIARREREQRDGRYLRVRQRDDGMIVGSFALDQEAGRILISALDTILSPRRGGPRFTDEVEQSSADRLSADPRTDDQIAADALIDMIQLAVDADPGTLFGSNRPGAQVIVTLDQYVSGSGYGFVPGAPEPVSIDTVRLRACSDGLVVAWSASCSPGPDSRWMSDAPNASSPPDSARRSAPGTAGAGSRAAGAHPRGARRITFGSGFDTREERMSPTASCYAVTIICSSTTTVGRSPASAATTASHHPRRWIPTGGRSRCRARTRS